MGMSERVEVLDETAGVDGTTRRVRCRHRTFDVTAGTAPGDGPTAWWVQVAELAADALGETARRDLWPLSDVSYDTPEEAVQAGYAKIVEMVRQESGGTV